VKRLSGIDATFLYVETPTTHMHVIGVILLDPSTMPPGRPYDHIRKMIEDRIHLMPAFRQKLVTVPFGLGHPGWINDGDFDLENHLRRSALPAPGDQSALAEVVGDIASRPLDRSRPLWEMWIVEGLEGGRIAAVTKMHHSTIDGASGADLMIHLLDLTPEVQPKDPPEEEFRGESKPSDVRMLAGALVEQVTNPVRMVQQFAKTAGNAVQMVRTLRGGSDGPAVAPFTAPRTAFSGALTPHRSVAFGRSSLEDLKTIRKAFDSKVNDVVLAISTYALRNYLLARGELPDKPLVASCPISVRTEGDERDSANQVSSMFVPLPVQIEDPAEQLEAIITATKRSKEMAKAMGVETLMDWTEFLSPRLFTLGMRLYSSMKIADYHPPTHNVIVSNVPGPPIPLYVAGAKVEAIYPLGPLVPGAGINITVLSNMGNVDFGLIASREAVPDLWQIADGMAEGVEVLLKEAAARPA
jgi:WS/DGAT/MGAT family acyltransferase